MWPLVLSRFRAGERKLDRKPIVNGCKQLTGCSVSTIVDTLSETWNGYLTPSVAVNGRLVMLVIFNSLCLTDRFASGL